MLGSGIHVLCWSVRFHSFVGWQLCSCAAVIEPCRGSWRNSHHVIVMIKNLPCLWFSHRDPGSDTPTTITTVWINMTGPPSWPQSLRHTWRISTGLAETLLAFVCGSQHVKTSTLFASTITAVTNHERSAFCSVLQPKVLTSITVLFRRSFLCYERTWRTAVRASQFSRSHP